MRPLHVHSRWAAAVAVALAILVIPVGLSLGAVESAPGPTAGRAPAPSGSAIPSVLSAPFADRAGYSAEYGPRATDVRPASGPVLVVVTFVPQNASEFFSTPATGAPPLSTAVIAARYGLTLGQYASFERFFLAHGLSIVHTWPDRLSLTVSGPAGAVGATFGTTLLAGVADGVSVTYPESAPELPSALEPMVGSVVGLSSGFDTFNLPEFPSIAPSATADQVEGANEVTPAIARQIYDLSDLYNVSGSFHPASSEGIALLLWGDGYAPSDLTTFYRDDYPSGFPTPTIDAYPIDGAPAPSSSAVNDPCKASIELTLDLEWAGSMAPGATLYPVYAPETAYPDCSPTDASMADAMNQAVDLDVAAISMSFGTPDSTSGGLAAAWATDFGVAVQRGISLVAATGDYGGDAQMGCQGGPAPEYPSTSPDVLAVGGTQVTLEYGVIGGVTGFTESAWSNSGGGYSTQYAPPAWQPSSFPGRGVPDVAATAAVNFVYFDGQDKTEGGTSFATPLWAGLITEMDAIHGSRLGLIAPRLYAIGNEENASSSRTPIGLAGITTGSNCVASAHAGWNAATGWGSPRALNLYEDLTATFVNLSLVASPTTVAQGATVTISGQLANATNGAPISGVPVTVSLASSVAIGPCTGVFGSTQTITGSGGNLSAALRVPSCYLGSHAVAQLLVTSDGYYGTNSTTIAVNLLGLVPALGFLGEFPYSVASFVLVLAVATIAGYLLGRPRPTSPIDAPSGAATGSVGLPDGPPPGPAAPPTDPGQSESR